MKTIDDIRRQLSHGEFEFTRHALKRVVERNISEQEISEAGENTRIIEEYLDDKYAPSCLVLGFTQHGCPLHLQISYVDMPFLRIITAYEPDEREWYDYSRRR